MTERSALRIRLNQNVLSSYDIAPVPQEVVASGPAYVLMPFIGGTEHALVGGSTLAEFLRSYGAGQIP